MYQPGDCVVYGIHGVCRLLQTEQRTVDRRKVQYYVLEPLDQPGSKYMIPTHNETAVAKLKPLLSKDQLEALLHSPQIRENAWIADENQRKQYYRELINSGDRTALLRMVRTLHRHKEEQTAAGRKFHLCDDNFLRDAQKLLTSEFSVVLNMDANGISDYVLSVIQE